MAPIWDLSAHCAPALIPVLFSRLCAGAGATVGLREGTLMPGSMRHLLLRKHPSPPALLGFTAGGISQPLGRRARSVNGYSPVLFLLWLFQWMKNMWRSDPCYAEYGVDGSTCSFFIYLSEVSSFLCLSGGGVDVCLVCSIAKPGIWKA